MPAYRQDHSFYEDGYGTVTITFVVSDTYEAMFADEFISTNIFIVGDSAHDLEESEGVQTEDELSFKMNEILVETDDDQDAFDFVLLATNPVNKRFCAKFINTGETPLIADAEFTGVLRPDFKAQDLFWHGDVFTTTPTPIREWDISAQSFFTNIFDEVEIKDLVYGNEDLMVDELDSTWKTANVFNREGYARTGSDRTTQYANLVNINKLLDKMATQLTDSLTARGLGEYSINFEVTTLDFKLSPARFTIVSKYGKHPRYTSIAPTTPSFVIKADDAIPIKMGSIGLASNAESMHLSYALFDPTSIASPPGSDEKTYKIVDNYRKFTDLLYGIAANIGCFVEFTYTDSVTLNIAFRPRTGIIKDPVFIRDVSKANLNTKPRSTKSDSRYYANANGLATEGADIYVWDNDDKMYLPSEKIRERKSGKRLPISISPTVRLVTIGDDDDGLWQHAKFPNNVIFYDDTTPANRGDYTPTVDSKGITTAIFLKVLRNGEYGFTDGDYLYAPAAALTVKIDGVDKVFETISEYINFITARDSISFETEYNLTLPFLCSFRRSADGSHANDDGGRGSWRNLKLGSQITIDGVDYAVVGIKRAGDKPETTLRLHHISRFAFAEPASLSGEIAPLPGGTYLSGGVTEENLGDNTRAGNYVPGAALVAGDFVTQLGDGMVYKSQAYHSHVLRVAGIAMHDVDEDDETVRVLEEGRFTSSRYSLVPGSPIFIRTSDAGDFNGSQSQLDDTTETEDTYISIARAVTSDTLVIRRGDEFVYSPQISDS